MATVASPVPHIALQKQDHKKVDETNTRAHAGSDVAMSHDQERKAPNIGRDIDVTEPPA